MKANEFVKKYGLDEAKRLLQRADGCKRISVSGVYCFEYDDLKRLVESHEIVDGLDGLDAAKKELSRQSVLRWVNPETERLRSAIADVESCL